MRTFQTAASAKELEQYHSEAQIWLDLLEEEVKQGENLKEEDFQENKVAHKNTDPQVMMAALGRTRLNNACVCRTVKKVL